MASWVKFIGIIYGSKFVLCRENTRGKGVGKQLLEHVEQLAKEAKCQLDRIRNNEFQCPRFLFKKWVSRNWKKRTTPITGRSTLFYDEKNCC